MAKTKATPTPTEPLNLWEPEWAGDGAGEFSPMGDVVGAVLPAALGEGALSAEWDGAGATVVGDGGDRWWFGDKTTMTNFSPFWQFSTIPLMKKKGPDLSNLKVEFPSSNLRIGFLVLHESKSCLLTINTESDPLLYLKSVGQKKNHHKK